MKKRTPSIGREVVFDGSAEGNLNVTPKGGKNKKRGKQ